MAQSLRLILPAPDQSNTWLPDSHAPCLNFPIIYRPASLKSAPVPRVLTVLLAWQVEAKRGKRPGQKGRKRKPCSRPLWEIQNRAFQEIYMDVLIDELLQYPSPCKQLGQWLPLFRLRGLLSISIMSTGPKRTVSILKITYNRK